MGYHATISKECIEFIKQQAKQGIKFTQIMKLCKENGNNVTYMQVCYHGGKVYSQKKKKMIELNFIESTTTLCQEMTSWIRMLRKEYDELHPDSLIDSIASLRVDGQLLVGEQERSAREEELKIRLRMLSFQRGDKRDLRFALNKGFENFVNLLKSPAIQTTQVNILQQQLEQSLGDIIHDRTTGPIKISN
jgi:hypothetical protein